MKVSTFIKRTWSQLTTSSASQTSSLSRAGSTASVDSLRSAVSSSPSVDSLDNVDNLKSHLAAHRDLAAFEALKEARAAGKPFPQRTAKKAAAKAVAKEVARVQGLVASRTQAQKTLIRARGAQRLAGLALHKAERDHGTHSLIAHEARKDLRTATRALGIASADLYVISQMS